MIGTDTLICIIGPTASGKTGTGIELARMLTAEIVSADSVQVYKGLDIGSAKPTKSEQEAVQHYMIDCVEIDDKEFSCAKYAQMASDSIELIKSKGKRALLVGGCGLYVNSLIKPLTFAVPKDETIRTSLETIYDEDPFFVWNRLKSIDPFSAEKLHPRDKKRIVRALEVYELSGTTLTEYNRTHSGPARYKAVSFGLKVDRDLLYERIENRVDAMIEEGLLTEAESIFKRGYPLTLPAMQSIGYKQIFEYLSGECTLEEAIKKIKLDTRHYAKRQMTWFNADKNITWIDITNRIGNYESIASEILDRCEKRNEA